MNRLLVVHHNVSPTTDEIVTSVIAGANDAQPELPQQVDIVHQPALRATAVDVLNCSAALLITPVNIGYMAGALKHFFDQIYYPTLTAQIGLPYAAVVHGNDDGAGAIRGIQNIANGLGWKQVAPPSMIAGQVDAATRQHLRELGMLAALAASESRLPAP